MTSAASSPSRPPPTPTKRRPPRPRPPWRPRAAPVEHRAAGGTGAESRSRIRRPCCLRQPGPPGPRGGPSMIRRPRRPSSPAASPRPDLDGPAESVSTASRTDRGLDLHRPAREAQAPGRRRDAAGEHETEPVAAPVVRPAAIRVADQPAPAVGAQPIVYMSQSGSRSTVPGLIGSTASNARRSERRTSRPPPRSAVSTLPTARCARSALTPDHHRKSSTRAGPNAAR